MTWGKVSDDLHSHPKWTNCSPNAKALWVTALSYSSSYLTDGYLSATEHLPTVAMETFGATPAAIGKARKAADELVQRKLWKIKAGGFEFHDWKDNNPMARTVRQRKKKDKRRDWLHKSVEGRELKRRVRERDGDICQLCAHPVRWGANRAPDGGTYDHWDPDGADTLDNLYVAHNACNGRKGDRDAVEAGMVHSPLLQAEKAAEQDVRPADTDTASSARLSRDSVATQSSRTTTAGAGRVGFGSGRDGTLTGRAGPIQSDRVHPIGFSPAPTHDPLSDIPHPTDSDFMGDEL